MNPEWVEAGTARLAEVTRERIVSHGEMVEIVITAVEPLIRADEQECLGWDTVWPAINKKNAQIAHAEAVAARLVEVICEQERELSAPWHLRLWRCGKCGLDWLPMGEDRTCPVCALRIVRGERGDTDG